MRNKQTAVPTALRSAIAATLFGLPFFGVGLGTASGLIWLLYRTYAARSWPAVPAQIQTVGLETRGGGRGGPTYLVVCTYEYTVSGQSHTSRRVAFGEMADNL